MSNFKWYIGATSNNNRTNKVHCFDVISKRSLCDKYNNYFEYTEVNINDVYSNSYCKQCYSKLKKIHDKR